MTFEEMSFKEKMDHIWEYYKIHIISVVVGLIIVYSLLDIWVLNPQPENIMDLTFRTADFDYENANILQDELTALLVEEDVNETAIIDFLQTGDSRDPNSVQATEAKFIGKIETGDLDLIVFEEGLMFERMTTEMALHDLNALEASYGYDFDEDLKVYLTDNATGNESAYLLDANKIPVIYNLTGAKEGVQYYIGVFLRAEDLERTLKALKYIVEK